MFELVPPGTHIDFVGKRRIAGALSAVLLLGGLVATFYPGPKWGIDFAGGTEIQVAFAETDAGVERVRAVVASCGVADPTVVRFGEGASEFLIRFRQSEDAATDASGCPLTDEQRGRLAQVAKELGVEGGADEGELVDRLRFALANEIGPVELQRAEFVGPRVGAELRADGIRAILLACGAILLYIGFRFSARFAPGAIVALVHDIGITAGLFVMLGIEFDLRVLAALLAILGYSLNDTIIIYDRIRENLELHTKADLPDVLNRSVNQTLSRTVLTSGTTMTALLALLFLGGEVIRPFALAMTIGVVVGTYSSIFIAAPTLLFLEGWLGGDEGTQAPAKAAHPKSSGGKSGEKGGKKRRKSARAASL